jgi:hypothetical protein
VLGGEQPEPGELRKVDVLKLVSEHAVEPRRPARAVALAALHGARRPQQQIPEIGGVRVAQPALVVGIDPGTGAQAVCIDRQAAAIGFGDHRLDLRRGLVGRDQVVFELGQPAAHEFQRIPADRRAVLPGGQVHRFEGTPDDPAAVIGIEDVEGGPQAGDLRFDPELARGKAVECA